MNAESEFHDEVYDRLTVLWNQIRMLRSDVTLRDSQNARDLAEIDRLEAKASHYEALFGVEIEGTSA